MARTSSNVTASGSASDAGPIDDDVADDVGADAPEQLAGDGADGDARSRFARAGALEHVADVVVPVLDDAGEIGVPGPRPRDGRAIDAGRLGRRRRLDRHRALPVLPVLVRNEQRDRRAGRDAVADAAQDLRAIGLDRPCGGRGRSRAAAGAVPR